MRLKKSLHLLFEKYNNNNIFMDNKLELVFQANKKLGLSEDLSKPRNKNVVFVFTPPKCGSTSLVSSLRLCCFDHLSVVHLHSEKMLKVMYNIHDLTVKEIINYNRVLQKNVLVIDIFRHPVEHKISLFFDILDTFHFNRKQEDLKQIRLETLFHRFNKLYPHIPSEDYFQTIYEIQPGTFKKEDNFQLVEDENGIRYLKLRLMDSETKWASILQKVLAKTKVFIVKDNITCISKKKLADLYSRFKTHYKLPINFLNDLKTLEFYYLTDEEKSFYLQTWEEKADSTFEPFTTQEFELYNQISSENKYLSQGHSNHYLANNCECFDCRKKKFDILNKLNNKPNFKKRFNLLSLNL
jgi:hypothetical protein